ncbi:winged helix-turn-helix transcriptional regulator [Belliella kenyensis]|uniref:winged helix-turn-helix transcriptional regulator n=1 Tax=Belliella kenyensis TaxID=1472724 RepID=UPI00338ECEAC
MSYNDTQKKILQHLFYHNQATISELVEVTGINDKTVRLYLNQFIDNEKVIDRLSDKQRDKNAKYAFKKL